MNTKNNKRRRDSVERIEKSFINFLQTKELSEISVTDICKSANINRSTFYANFLDVYDLADKIKEKIEADFDREFERDIDDTADSLIFFQHIKNNQIIYKTYFKLGYDNNYKMKIYEKHKELYNVDDKHLLYHIEFFRNGLNAILKMWLAGGCKESPEEMDEIIKSEYRGRV